MVESHPLSHEVSVYIYIYIYIDVIPFDFANPLSPLFIALFISLILYIYGQSLGTVP